MSNTASLVFSFLFLFLKISFNQSLLVVFDKVFNVFRVLIS